MSCGTNLLHLRLALARALPSENHIQRADPNVYEALCAPSCMTHSTQINHPQAAHFCNKQNISSTFWKWRPLKKKFTTCEFQLLVNCSQLKAEEFISFLTIDIVPFSISHNIHLSYTSLYFIDCVLPIYFFLKQKFNIQVWKYSNLHMYEKDPCDTVKTRYKKAITGTDICMGLARSFLRTFLLLSWFFNFSLSCSRCFLCSNSIMVSFLPIFYCFFLKGSFIYLKQMESWGSEIPDVHFGSS